MAAEKPRPEKVAVVDDVRAHLSSSNAALLTEYRGLTVSELAQLRLAISDAGGEYRIYKNTLARIAANDLGVTGLDPLLTGPTAFAFVHGDAVAVAKSLRDFARSNPKLVVKGGLLGTKVLSAGDASALADVAPREVQLAQLAGALAAPMRQMAALLAALPTNFAYGMAALIEARGGVGAIPASEPATPELADQPEVADQPEEEGPAASTTEDSAPQDNASVSDEGDSVSDEGDKE